MIPAIFLLNEEGKFIENLSVLIKELKDGHELLLDLAFCAYLVREKSQEILKSDVCSNQTSSVTMSSVIK